MLQIKTSTVTNLTAAVLDTTKATVKSATLSGGSLATVVIASVKDANGATQITYTATDNLGLVATKTVNLTITPVNDPPSISFIEKLNEYLGTPILNRPFVIGDVDYANSVKDITVRAASSNEKVIPSNGILITPGNGSSDPNRTFSLFPMGAGDTTITISVTDTNNATSVSSFPVHIQDSGNLIWASPGPITVAANSTALPYYPLTNIVKNMKGAVSDIQVTLFNVNSRNPGDLRVLLVSTNTSKRPVMLMGNVIGNNAVTGATFVFSDAAPATLPSGSPATSGVYKPSTATSDSLTHPRPRCSLREPVERVRRHRSERRVETLH